MSLIKDLKCLSWSEFSFFMNSKFSLRNQDCIKINSMITLNFIFNSVLICLYGLYQYIFCFLIYSHFLSSFTSQVRFGRTFMLSGYQLIRYLDINFCVFYSFIVSFSSLLLYLSVQTSYFILRWQRLLDQLLMAILSECEGLSKTSEVTTERTVPGTDCTLMLDNRKSNSTG